jgi:hypothetical protein
MPIAKLWKTAPGTVLSVKVTAGTNVQSYGMSIDMTILATQSSIHEERTQSELKAGFQKAMDEGVVYSFNLTTIPVDPSKNSTLTVAMVPTNPNGPVPDPDNGTYTFSKTQQIWTWKIF